jgi:hypothetical protein
MGKVFQFFFDSPCPLAISNYSHFFSDGQEDGACLGKDWQKAWRQGDDVYMLYTGGGIFLYFA